MSESAREVRLIGGPRDGKTVFVAPPKDGVIEVNDPNPPVGRRQWTYHVVDFDRLQHDSDPGEVWTAKYVGNHDMQGGHKQQRTGYDVDA